MENKTDSHVCFSWFVLQLHHTISWLWMHHKHHHKARRMNQQKPTLHKKKSQTQRQDSRGNNASWVKCAAALFSWGAFRLWTTDPGLQIHHPLPPHDFSSTHSSSCAAPSVATANQQILPSASPWEDRVCLWIWVSVCVCSLMEILAVMCLMEDKQHSLKRVFTTKRLLSTS